MVLTMLVSVPATVMFLDWMGTLWGGVLRYEPQLLFALGLLGVFSFGGLTGLYLADVPIDVYLHDTAFVVGHFHLTMATAVVMGLFAAIYHWYPKMFGRHMSRGLGIAHFWLTLLPLVGLFVTMMWMGHAGMPRRLYDPSIYETFRPLQRYNKAATHLAYLVGAAQLIFIWNFVVSRFRGARADANPWKLPTLEWSLSSPPPAESFAESRRWCAARTSPTATAAFCRRVKHERDRSAAGAPGSRRSRGADRHDRVHRRLDDDVRGGAGRVHAPAQRRAQLASARCACARSRAADGRDGGARRARAR